MRKKIFIYMCIYILFHYYNHMLVAIAHRNHCPSLSVLMQIIQF